MNFKSKRTVDKPKWVWLAKVTLMVVLGGQFLTPGDPAEAASCDYSPLRKDYFGCSSIFGRPGGADLSAADLRGVSFANVSLALTNLAGSDLTGADLTGSDLRGSDLTGTHLTGANLNGLKSGAVVGSPTSLPIDWALVGGYLIGPKADLSKATLVDADLSGANLSGAKLQSADLTRANLEGTNLTSTNLDGAILTGAASGNITGTPSSLPSVIWKLTNGYLIGPRADLSGADLSGANLTTVRSGEIIGTPASLPAGWQLICGYLVGPGANLTDADFSRVDLTDANLTGANLTRAILSGSTLTRASLTNADLTGVSSGEIKGAPTSLPTQWKLTKGYLVGPGANLKFADLSNVDLTNAYLNSARLDFVASGGIIGTPSSLPLDWSLVGGYLIGQNAELREANLAGANLASATLAGANLTGANFTGANLTGAWMSGAKIENADLTSTNLTEANLSYSYLTGSKLDKATLSKAILTGITSGGLSGTVFQLPNTFSISDGFLFSPTANLRSANLQGVNLTNRVLTDANLNSANLTGVTLSKATNLYRANLAGVKSGGIVGETANLPTGWKLINGYLIGPGADLAEANLEGADLTGVTLTRVKSGGIKGSPTLPPGWKLISGYLIGPGANLTDANLSDLWIENANLTGANLTGANLQRLKLIDTNLMGATFSENKNGGIVAVRTSFPTGWKLRNGFLIGLNADLSGADFTDAELDGSGLATWTSGATGIKSGGTTGVPLSIPSGWALTKGYLVGPGADLTNANLAGADLTGAYLKDATLTGVKSGGITGTPGWLPDGWQVVKGYLVGPGANLSGADLSNADLRDANLLNSNLEGANLVEADLRGANCTPVVCGSLASTNLRGANLTNANLKGANLSGANLRNTNFTSANVTGVNFRQSNLIGAVVSDLSFDSNFVIPSGLVVESSRLLGLFSSSPAPSILGQNQTGKTLAASIGSWDVGTQTTIQWLRDGNPIQNATGTSYKLLASDVGHQINVQVTGRQDGYKTEVRTGNSITAELASFAASPTPLVLGLHQTGRDVTATVGIWDVGTQTTIQWLRDGNPIQNATGTSYKLLASDVGHEFNVQVTGTQDGYTTQVRISDPVRAQLGVLAKKTPTILGTPKVGKKLLAKASPAATGVKITWQWLLDGKVIKGATGSSYTLLKAQKGKKISVRVSQSLTGYAGFTLTSGSSKIG